MDNIDDYTTEELMDLFGLTKPYTMIDVHSAMSSEKLKEENKNPKMYRFIDEAAIKLSYSIGPAPNQVYDFDEHLIMDQSQQSYDNYQGVVPRIINLDSKFRANSYPGIDSVTGHDETYDLESILNSSTDACSPSNNRSSTDYTAYLSEPLTSILSLNLYNIDIPYVWYNIDSAYGNNYFQYVTHVGPVSTWNYLAGPSASTLTDKLKVTRITLIPGQYDLYPGSETNIYAAINILIGNKNVQFEYDHRTKKTIINYFTTDFSGNYRKNTRTQKPFTILWYNGINCPDTISKSNQNLGWQLGFRREISYLVNTEDEPGVDSWYIDLSSAHSPLGKGVFCHIPDPVQSDLFYNTDKTISYNSDSNRIYYKHNHVYTWDKDNNVMLRVEGLLLSPFGREEYIDCSGTVTRYWKYSTVSDAPANLLLTKYLLLSIEDYNNNKLNSGLVSIQNAEEIVQPNSKNRDLKISQCPDGKDKNYYQYSIGLSGEVVGVTQAQLASINAIAKHQANINNKTTAPTDSVFAIIQIPSDSMYGGNITNRFPFIDNQITYSGPSTLTRLKIKLLTEDGVVLNLNKCDWSVSLICKQLYQ